jgi:hypothetical protein
MSVHVTIISLKSSRPPPTMASVVGAGVIDEVRIEVAVQTFDIRGIQGFDQLAKDLDVLP